MDEITNYMKMTMAPYSRNEALARMCAAAFASQLDPTIEEMTEIKAAVSEAVTNCIVHAYKYTTGDIRMEMKIIGTDTIYIKIRDKGCGIPDVKKAMEALFTTSPENERSGLGFSVMESFMDKVKVTSAVGKGTTVTMTRKLTMRNEQIN